MVNEVYATLSKCKGHARNRIPYGLKLSLWLSLACSRGSRYGMFSTSNSHHKRKLICRCNDLYLFETETRGPCSTTRCRSRKNVFYASPYHYFMASQCTYLRKQFTICGKTLRYNMPWFTLQMSSDFHTPSADTWTSRTIQSDNRG